MSDKMTMEDRMEAFFRQSGGPHNPAIQKLLQKHLLYGKDHGMPGYKETFEDAIIDAVVHDPSLLLLFERFQRWRSRGPGSAQTIREIEERLQDLEREVRELRAFVQELIERIGS